MDFNEKGFLGTSIDDFSKSVQVRYSKFFELSHQINELAHAIKFELKVHNRDHQEFLAAALFLRLLNGFEAVVILGIKGLLFEAKVVLRSVIETLFILKLLCEEEAFALEYLGSSKAQSLKWMNIAHENQDSNFESLRQYATPEVMEALRAEIKQHGLKKLEVEPVAKRAGLHHFYSTQYRLLCEQVHCLPISLDPFMVQDNDGDLSSFDGGPKHDEIDFVLFANIQMLLTALAGITNLFDLNKRGELEKIGQALSGLTPLLGASKSEGEKNATEAD
ncbi:MAG: hypothetical protein K0S45_3147 [Nitrospira sp.]|jgi:hypothetical protein|nr:hypothetical protein [Nitrospira sp.]